MMFCNLLYLFITCPLALLTRKHHDGGITISYRLAGEINVKNQLAALFPDKEKVPSVNKLHIDLKCQRVRINAAISVKHVFLQDREDKLTELVVFGQLLLLSAELLGEDNHDLEGDFSIIGQAFDGVDTLKDAPDKLKTWHDEGLHLEDSAYQGNLAISEYFLLVKSTIRPIVRV